MGQPAFKDGDGGGEAFDPRDVTIYCLELQVAEFRAVMRRLLDAEGPDAAGAIEAAEKLCNGWDQVDREVEDENARDAYHDAPICDCGTWKGAGTSYCPECDEDAIARLKAQEPSNVVSLNCPF